MSTKRNSYSGFNQKSSRQLKLVKNWKTIKLPALIFEINWGAVVEDVRTIFILKEETYDELTDEKFILLHS